MGICFFREEETYFTAGNNASRVAKLGNICRVQMFLATSFLVLPGLEVKSKRYLESKNERLFAPKL